MITIILYHLNAWLHGCRVFKFNTTYGHFYASKHSKQHVRVHRKGYVDKVTVTL